jgi:hypothetical protein
LADLYACTSKFFFFQSSTATGPRLYLANLDQPTEGIKQIAESKGRFTAGDAPVIPISDDEVVFPIHGDAGRTPPYRYNLVTDTLSQLPFARQCTPYVWRSASEQVLCGVDGKGEFYLVSLDGQRMTPVSFSGIPDTTRIPLLYIAAYDVLILTVSGFRWCCRNAGEHFDLWAYSFKDGRAEKLIADSGPGRGGIVWVSQ